MASSSSLKIEPDTSEPFKRQGSLRKVLPSLPSADSQLSMSVKMIDRATVSNRGNLIAYSQYQQEYSTISEYNMLRKQDIPGIYVIPSAHSSLLWFGVLFIRQGLYQGGIFRFNIILPENFPDGGCPRSVCVGQRVMFQTRVYHPMVNADTGEMDVRSGFQDWRKNVNHIWQILVFLRRVFYKIETRAPVNLKAATAYETDQVSFREGARACVTESIDRAYEPPASDDPHYITFDPYIDELHGPIRDAIFNSRDDDNAPNSIGLSWVQPGSLEPFSRASSG